MAVPRDAWESTVAVTSTGGRVPELARVTPVPVPEPTRVATRAVAEMTSLRTIELLGGSTAGQGSSRRARQFRTIRRESPL